MQRTPVCPTCGAVLATDAPEGLCPGCLIGIGHGGPESVEGEGEVAVTQPEVEAAAGVALTVGCVQDEPSSVSPPTVRYFGDYELLEELGRGGMGVIYRARQVNLNRLVALKMILAGQLASPADVRRFRVEAEAAANLDHPGIVPIYEVGEQDGQHYFGMKLVEGGSLAGAVARLVGQPREAARTLAAARPGGPLCAPARDPSPRPEAREYLARRAIGANRYGLWPGEARSASTVRSRSPVPSWARRAICHPNRLRVPGEKSPRRPDVYALGAILYELLSGRPPFVGDSVTDTLFQVLENEPAHPRTLNPRADRDLSTIALKCLEKDPRRRYPSASAWPMTSSTGSQVSQSRRGRSEAGSVRSSGPGEGRRGRRAHRRRRLGGRRRDRRLTLVQRLAAGT